MIDPILQAAAEVIGVSVETLGNWSVGNHQGISDEDRQKIEAAMARIDTLMAEDEKVAE